MLRAPLSTSCCRQGSRIRHRRAPCTRRSSSTGRCSCHSDRRCMASLVRHCLHSRIQPDMVLLLKEVIFSRVRSTLGKNEVPATRYDMHTPTRTRTRKKRATCQDTQHQQHPQNYTHTSRTTPYRTMNPITRTQHRTRTIFGMSTCLRARRDDAAPTPDMLVDAVGQ